MQTARLDNIWERFVWTIRLYRSKQSLPKSREAWYLLDNVATNRVWEFLRPFFDSRGYTLYKLGPNGFALPSVEGAHPTHPEYPYARTLDKDTPGFIFLSQTVRAAQDAQGNHVVVKLISAGDKPSDEWLILQYLNFPELRLDPRNHTIPVIEFIKFDNFVFAVMPRWDNAFYAPFTKVSELLDLTKICFEALDFLHTHRIAYQDFKAQNTGMNILGSFEKMESCTAARMPGEVDYAFYDFGHSLMYPNNVDISTVQTTRFLRYSHAPSPQGPYNPFKSDVAMLGGMLQGRLRHAQPIVPKIEPFIDWTMTLDENHRPLAKEAFDRFMALCNDLTPLQLNAPINSTFSNALRSKLLPSVAEMRRQKDEARKNPDFQH